jgi:hypothetical protein
MSAAKYAKKNSPVRPAAACGSGTKTLRFMRQPGEMQERRSSLTRTRAAMTRLPAARTVSEAM